MKYRFIIERASDIGGLSKPCEEAKKFSYTHKYYFREKETIAKEFVWVIEFETLDSLMSFVSRYGSIIINYKPYPIHEELEKENFMSMTIYDYYIE